MTDRPSYIWKRDINFGRSERNHWRKMEVIGETSKSWLIGYSWRPIKVPKKGPWDNFLFSDEEVERVVWASDHRYKITHLVERANYDQLKKIAEIINYQE